MKQILKVCFEQMTKKVGLNVCIFKVAGASNAHLTLVSLD